MGAVDADRHGLRQAGEISRALPQQFAVSYALLILAGEVKRGGEIGIGRERLADGLRFGE